MKLIFIYPGWSGVIQNGAGSSINANDSATADVFPTHPNFSCSHERHKSGFLNALVLKCPCSIVVQFSILHICIKLYPASKCCPTLLKTAMCVLSLLD